MALTGARADGRLPPQHFEYLQLILLAVAVGLLAALGNLAFRELIRGFSLLFQTQSGSLLQTRHGPGRLLLPLLVASGGVLLLGLDYFFPGDVLGYGFPNFLENVNLGNARLRKRWIILKALGASISLGCGASVGREGPIAQIGGAIGSALAQVRKLSTDRARVLIAAGAGAGIATTFNAPMGGMMFAQEIVLLGETELGNLTLVLIATFSAVVLSRALTGTEPIFHPAPFVLDNYWQMLTYGAMGIVLGAMSALYIRFFHGAARYIRSIPLRPSLRLLAGLAIVGAIAIILPQNLSDGYPVIDQALRGQLGMRLMIALTIAKFVASAISLDAGAPGGVFGPIFFIGAMAGGSFRGLSKLVAPRLTGPAGSYALVGLGGFLSGVTHAPLTALLLLFEMTRGDWTVVLPSMITIIGALVVARSIEHESIDTYSLALRGINLDIGRDRVVLTQLPVSSVLKRETQTVRAQAPLTEVMRVAGETSQATLPVLNDLGGLSGLIVTHDLLSLLATGAELGALANAWDLSRRNPPVLAMNSNLDQALQLMEYEALDEMPVLQNEHNGAYIGLVARQDIARAFNRVSLSISALATRDDNIFWASGYRVARMRAPRGAVGKTLRQLDLRSRFGVSVLAVQDNPDDGFVPSSAERPFKPSDLIIAAGSSAALRRFTRTLESSSAPTAVATPEDEPS